MDDPRYLVPGTNIFNFTKWSRENIPKGEPVFKVGDRVRLTAPLYVIHVGEGCDGTPLFSLALYPDSEEAVRLSGLAADSLEALRGEADGEEG